MVCSAFISNPFGIFQFFYLQGAPLTIMNGYVYSAGLRGDELIPGLVIKMI